MSNGNIEKLVALLRTGEEGEETASLLNEFLIDDRKKNALIVRLKELKAEVATLKLRPTPRTSVKGRFIRRPTMPNKPCNAHTQPYSSSSLFLCCAVS